MSKRNKKKELPNRKITAWSTVEKKDVYDLTGDDEGSTDDRKQTSSRSERGEFRAAMKSKEDLIDERLKAAGISDHGQMSLEEKKELLEVLGDSLIENSVLKSHEPSYLCKPEGRPSIHGSPCKSTSVQPTTSTEASAAVLESDDEITVEDPKPTKGHGKSHRKPTSRRQSLLSRDKPMWKDDRIHSVDTTKRRNKASQQRREQELNDSQRSNSSLGGYTLSGESVTSKQDIEDLNPGLKVKDDDEKGEDGGAQDEGQKEYNENIMKTDGSIDFIEKESNVMNTEDGANMDSKAASASSDASLDPLVLTETSTDNLTDGENGPTAAASNVRVTTMNDLISHADTNTDKSDRVTVTITSMDEDLCESVIYKKDFPGETRLSSTETDKSTNITCDKTQTDNPDAGSQELFQSQPTPWQEKVSEVNEIEEDMDIYEGETQPLSPSGDSRGHYSSQSQEEKHNLKRKASTCSEEELCTKRPHLTETDFMSHDPEPSICLVNKRRIACKYIDKQPCYAPAGKSVRSYAKVIHNYFTQYGVLLRKAQSKQMKQIPWGKPIEVGRHWSKTIDAKKRGQHSMYIEMYSDDSDLEILDNTTKAHAKYNSNSKKLQIKKSATLPVTESKYTDNETDEDFQEMPSFQPKLRKLRSLKNDSDTDRIYHSQSQTSDISRKLSPGCSRNEILSGSPQGDSKSQETTGSPPGGSRIQESPGSPPGGSRSQEPPGSPPGVRRRQEPPGSPPGGSRNQVSPGSPPGGSRSQESPGSPPDGIRSQELPGSPPGSSSSQESPGSPPGGSSSQESQGDRNKGSPRSSQRSGSKIKNTIDNMSQSCSETKNYESDRIKQNVGETEAVLTESEEEELRDKISAQRSGSPLRKEGFTADGQYPNTDEQLIKDGCTSESQDDSVQTDLKLNLSSQETDDAVEFGSVGSPVFGRWMKGNQLSPRKTTPAKKKILGRKRSIENESEASEDPPEDNSTADEFEENAKSRRRRLLRSEISNIFENIGDFGDDVHTVQNKNKNTKGQTDIIGRGQRGRGRGTLKKGHRSSTKVKDTDHEKREDYTEELDLEGPRRGSGQPQNTATTAIPAETRSKTSEGTSSEEDLVIENDNSSQSAPPHVRPLNITLEKLDSMLQSQDSQSSQGLSASDTSCDLPESPIISRDAGEKTSLSKKLPSERNPVSSGTPRSSLTRRKLRDAGHEETPQTENTNTIQCVDDPPEGATSQETVQCPLCGEYFSRDSIETHAANCPGQRPSQPEARVTRQVKKSQHGPAITISSPAKKPAKKSEKVSTLADKDNNITVNDDTDQVPTADTSNEEVLGDCPLCGKQFSIAALVEHANQCLDTSVNDKQEPIPEGQQRPPALRVNHPRKTEQGSRDDGAGDSVVRLHRQTQRKRDREVVQNLKPKKPTLQAERKTESPGPSRQRFSRKPFNRSGIKEDHEHQVDSPRSTRHSGIESPATSSEASAFDKARAILKKQMPHTPSTGASTVTGASRGALRRRGRVQEEIQLISDSESDLPEERRTLRTKKRKRYNSRVGSCEDGAQMKRSRAPGPLTDPSSSTSSVNIDWDSISDSPVKSFCPISAQDNTLVDFKNQFKKKSKKKTLFRESVKKVKKTYTRGTGSSKKKLLCDKNNLFNESFKNVAKTYSKGNTPKKKGGPRT